MLNYKYFPNLKSPSTWAWLLLLIGFIATRAWVLPLNFVANLELSTLTYRQMFFYWHRLEKKIESPIVIVAVDNSTLQSDVRSSIFGRTWESRAMYGYATRFFNRTQPAKVIFDYSFDAGTDTLNPEGDQLLVDSVNASGKTASDLMFFNDSPHEQRKGLNWKDQSPATQAALLRNTINVEGIKNFPVLQRYEFNSLVPPFSSLLQSKMQFFSAMATDTGYPFGSIVKDSSGLERRWIPFSIYGGHFYPSIQVGAILKGKSITLQDGRLKFDDRQVKLGQEGLPFIKWYGHRVTNQHLVYKEYSFWDVVQSELTLECQENPALYFCPKLKAMSPVYQPEVFKDKYILINKTYSAVTDRHKIIFSNDYPGVYIMANELDNLLRDDFVLPAPWWMNIAALLVMGGLASWACFRFTSIAMSGLVIFVVGGIYALLTNQFYSDFNLWLNLINPLLLIFSIFIGNYFYRYLTAEKKRQDLRYAFMKYVSPVVMTNLEKNPDEALSLKGQRREVSLLFCDIRGFTTFSENHPPEVVQQFLSPYFAIMNRIIRVEYEGTISKLMGDAIMAYWGFPAEKQDHAFLSVSAALAMKEALKKWQDDPEKPPLNIGIGINTGQVMIGNIGSEDFLDFTVIGDAVNLASRLEGMNKEFGTNIIISESTYEKVKDRIEVRSLGNVKVKGKEQETTIYEPLGFKLATVEGA